jgi:hypothetical protein
VEELAALNTVTGKLLHEYFEDQFHSMEELRQHVEDELVLKSPLLKRMRMERAAQVSREKPTLASKTSLCMSPSTRRVLLKTHEIPIERTQIPPDLLKMMNGMELDE